MKSAAAAVTVTALLGLCAAPLLSAPESVARPAAAKPAVPRAPDKDALFSGDYKETSARDVLLDIARAAGMSAVLPSPLDGNITAHIDKMPVMQALDLVTGLAGADYRVMDGTIYVVRRGVTARPPETALASGRDAESEVERIASRIDAQDASAAERARARRAAPAAPSAPVYMEMSVNIQTSAPSLPMPAFPPDCPVFGGVVYAPLNGVYQVGWSPRTVTRFPGGPFAPPWRTYGRRSW